MVGAGSFRNKGIFCAGSVIVPVIAVGIFFLKSLDLSLKSALYSNFKVELFIAAFQYDTGKSLFQRGNLSVGINGNAGRV